MNQFQRVFWTASSEYHYHVGRTEPVNKHSSFVVFRAERHEQSQTERERLIKLRSNRNDGELIKYEPRHRLLPVGGHVISC